MNDQTKRFMLKTMLFNNRLRTYQNYLILAQNKGYLCCSFIDFFHQKDSSKIFFILRHDVDDVSPATRKMFEAEKAIGVTSTYYFRDSTVDIALIREMLASGFEVGYHYETLATLYAQKHITSKADIDIEAARQQFCCDRERFEQRIGQKIFSCASHGAPENAILDVSNNIIFENIAPCVLGVEIEAYDESLYTNYIDYHIMDGPITHNFGFSYHCTNPLVGIAQHKKAIVFLAHPCHWHSGARRYIINWLIFLTGRATYSTMRTFRRIATL